MTYGLVQPCLSAYLALTGSHLQTVSVMGIPKMDSGASFTLIAETQNSSELIGSGPIPQKRLEWILDVRILENVMISVFLAEWEVADLLSDVQ